MKILPQPGPFGAAATEGSRRATASSCELKQTARADSAGRQGRQNHPATSGARDSEVNSLAALSANNTDLALPEPKLPHHDR